MSDYLLAGRDLGITAVTISIIATSTSAATFIGGPDTSFRGDITYLQTAIGTLCSRFFLAAFFIPAFYELRAVTVYELLRERFGIAIQKLGAALFIFGRLFASGARLYIAGFAISIICEIDLASATLLAAAVAIAYSTIGGLRTVVYTDMLQGIVFLSAGISTIALIYFRLGNETDVFATLAQSDKLKLINWSWDIFNPDFWANPYTFLAAVFGGFILGCATHGTDQDMVQRMLACRSSSAGRRSLIYSALLEIPTAIIFVCLGLGLWLLYTETGLTLPDNNQSIFPHFIREHLPSGFRGLLVAALFAAAMSSLDSAINSLASVSISDFTKKGCASVKAGIRWSLIWGAVLSAIALLLGTYHQFLLTLPPTLATRENELLSLALGVMAIVYGPLLAIFITGIFTKRGSTLSIFAGTITGLITVCWLKFFSSISVGWTWHVVIGFTIALSIDCLGKRKIAT